MARPTTLFLMLVLLLATGSLIARGADVAAEVELQRALDSPIDLTLQNQDLSKAFDAIAAAAKISMQIDPACYEALPYGPTTRVSTVFRATPVRAAIDEVASILGLEQIISGNNLIIRPSRALTYIGRRAELPELKLLQDIRSQQLLKLENDWTADLRTLLGRPDFILKTDLPDAPIQDKAMAQVRAVLPCTVAQALDTYAAATNQIWTVQGQSVVVMPMRKWIERQLGRPIVVHFTNAALADVIAELAHLSRLPFQPEAGLYLAVPKVSLDSQDGTVRMTLDALAGATGIAYEIKDDGVTLHLPGHSDAAPTPRADTIVGRIAVPLGNGDMTFDLFLRESDLPPEINELRKKRLADVTAQIQQALITTRPAGVVPTPAPLPGPAPAPSTTTGTAPAK